MFCRGLGVTDQDYPAHPEGWSLSLFEDAHGGFDNLAPRLSTFRPKPLGFTGFEPNRPYLITFAGSSPFRGESS